ncbi:hypothetical protein CsSME_00033827 [Camellia sinensis var. sinensis]
MAATAAAAVASSFSTSMQTLKCIRSNKYWASSSDPLLRISSTTRMLFQVRLVSLSHIHAPEAFLGGPISQKCRIPRISAAVDQEEAAATPSVEAAPPPAEVEVEVEVEELSSGGDDEEVISTVNTKLYFGNLPYHCDSAQLAGIIQEYASPELVEVFQSIPLTILLIYFVLKNIYFKRMISLSSSSFFNKVFCWCYIGNCKNAK